MKQKTPKNIHSPQTKPIAKSAALPNVDGGKTVVSSNGAQGQSADTNIFPEEVYGHYINGRKFNRAHSQEEMDASRVGEGLSSKKKTRSDTQTSDDEILKEAKLKGIIRVENYLYKGNIVYGLP